MALTFNQVNAITDAFYMPKFPELVFNRNFIQKRLHAKGTKPDSGDFIKQPLMYQINKGGAYRPHDVFNVDAEDQITAAQFEWKYYEVPITLSRDEILKNRGTRGVKKLLDAKTKLASSKMSDLLATDFFAAAGDDATAEINSFLNIAQNTAGTLAGVDTTCGTIDKTAYAFWSGVVVNNAAAGHTYTFLNTHWMLIADGDITPTIMVGDNAMLAAYMNTQQDQQRYMKQSMMDSGFTATEFNGKPFVADQHSRTNEIAYINEEFLDMVSHADENMRFEPFAKPIDQAVSVAHVYWAGNLTSSDCSRQGVLTNVT